MTRRVMVAVVVVVMVAGACVGLPEPTPLHHHLALRQASPAATLGGLIQEFGLDLAAELQTDGNLAISPLSVAMLLSSLMLGTVGVSKDQLFDVLYLPPNANENAVHLHFQQLINDLTNTGSNVTVNIANGLFLREGVEVQVEYTRKARQYYDTIVSTLNFNIANRATHTVNEWVRQETNGMIRKLLTQPLSTQTIFFAVNTVFFNGTWATPFHPSATTIQNFTTGTRTLQVPMMSGMLHVSYIDLPVLNAHMVAIPYEGGQFAMFILMRKGPVSTNPQDLQELEFELDTSILNSIINNMTQLNMLVELPRMRLSYKTSLTGSLLRLGASAIFNPRLAGFDRLTTQKTVWVDEVIHETVVEVTETGTTASSATGAGLNRIGNHKSFLVNRPAVFFIRHIKLGVPLFWGRVMNPEPLSRTG